MWDVGRCGGDRSLRQKKPCFKRVREKKGKKKNYEFYVNLLLIKD